MRFIYIVSIGAGWAYIGHRLHWPVSVTIVASAMTVTFAFYLSRVSEDDRNG
jgi:hypothetical protein